MGFPIVALAGVALLAPWSLAQKPATLKVSFNEVNRVQFAFDARLAEGSLPCGPRKQITSNWVEETNQFWRRTNQNKDDPIDTQAATFNSGTLTIPVDGVYLLFGSGRCETGACDVTLRLNGNRIAGFGTDLIQRMGDNGNRGSTWATHSVSKIQRAEGGQTFELFYESGAGSDCIQETSFFYAHMGALLIFADNDNPTDVVG